MCSMRSRRAESLALGMNLVAQPAQQTAEIAACEWLIQPAQIGLGLGVKLSRIKIAQRVRRKIANQAGAPVDVLQAALRRRCGA